MQRYLTSLGALVILLSATVAYAQQPTRTVLDNYRKGLKAIQDKQWDVAITALNAAVGQDAKDRTWRESTLSEPYYPHYYLFVAYLQAGNTAKARENYDRRGELPRDLVAESNRYLPQLTKADMTFAPWPSIPRRGRE